MSDKYKDFAATVGELVDEKQAAYGDSFNKCGKIMEILYPNGIPVSGLVDALGVARTVDKLFRIASRKNAFGESPWKDIAGYGLLGAYRDEKQAPKQAPLVEQMPLPVSKPTDQMSNVLSDLNEKLQQEFDGLYEAFGSKAEKGVYHILDVEYEVTLATSCADGLWKISKRLRDETRPELSTSFVKEKVLFDLLEIYASSSRSSNLSEVVDSNDDF